MTDMVELAVGDRVSYVIDEDVHGWETKGYGEIVSISHNGNKIFIRDATASKYVCVEKGIVTKQKGE